MRRTRNANERSLLLSLYPCSSYSLSFFFFLWQKSRRLFMLSYIFIVHRAMALWQLFFASASLPFLCYLKHLVLAHTGTRAGHNNNYHHSALIPLFFPTFFASHFALIVLPLKCKKIKCLLLLLFCAQISKPKNSLWKKIEKFHIQIQIV